MQVNPPHTVLDEFPMDFLSLWDCPYPNPLAPS